MYVKIVPDEGNETIYPTGDSPVTTGSVTLYNPVDYDGKSLNDLLGIEGSSRVHCFGPYLNYSAGEEMLEHPGGSRRYWKARFAWWEANQPDHFFEGVIVGGQIYVLGENGKTIDKAR